MLDSIPSFARLVAELAKFPGIGTKTATRLAFFLLRQPDAEAAALATAIVDLKRNTRFCSVCFHITEQDPCVICADPVRDQELLCVVEEPQAVLAVERSRSFRGRYHVLHGALSPLDGIGPDDLNIAGLVRRAREPEIREVDFALPQQRDEQLVVAGGKSLQDVERDYILRVMDECDGNQTRAARVLHIDRVTLHNKLKSYGWSRNNREP